MVASYFVTGAAKGIGLEMVRQLVANPDNKVVAVVRTLSNAQNLLELQKSASDRLTVIPFDVADLDGMPGLAKQVETILPEGLDVLILNAAVLLQGTVHFENIDAKSLQQELLINTIIPIVTLQVFLPLLRKAPTKKVVFMSSSAASIGLTHQNLWWANTYSTTKAALNMAVRQFGLELLDEEFTLIPIHPGWVKTDMGTLAEGEPDLTADQSAAMVLNVVQHSSVATSTKFVDYRGEPMPW